MEYPLFIFFFTVATASSTTTYGLFDLSVQKIEFCKGPKQKDCCVAVANHITNKTDVAFDIAVKENVSPTKGKIITSSDNVNDLGVRLQLKRPCDNLFLGPLFKSIFNMTSECVIQKGHYKFHLDLQDVLRSYYGGMHLYGTRIFKSVFYNDDCNFLCTYTEMKLTPKSK